MRRIAYFCCCLLLFHVSAFAQSSKVRVSSLLLTQEKNGWRVDFPDGEASKYSLQSGDLLISINARTANHMGPLAVLAAFNEGLSRVVPLRVQRGTEFNRVSLWRSDEPPPPASTKPRRRAL